jgi:hypothetical protein
MRHRWALVSAVVAAVLAVGGVAAAWQSSGEPADPAPGAASSVPALSPSSSSRSAGDRENADRADVEATWRQFLDVYDAVESRKYPRNDWTAVVGSVAVDPTYSQVIRSATEFERLGLVVYGSAIARPYWTESVGGGLTAVMGDCADTSRTGSMFEGTGRKRTVGKVRDNTRVTFVRGSDGEWRVKLIESLVDQPC